jgi:hypothetical protein
MCSITTSEIVSGAGAKVGTIVKGIILKRQLKKIAMKTKKGKGAGQSFVETQKSTDDAINERMKEEQGKNTLDPEQANNPANRNRQSDTGSKKTGGGKQKGPGM